MKRKSTQKSLSAANAKKLLRALKARFEENMNRHKGVDWNKVEAKLMSNPDKLWSLSQMEKTGGEPDVVGHDKKTGEYLFFDCAQESPSGRRSLCYDRAAWEARKEARPLGSALEMAEQMGVTVLTETQYRALQKLGQFDLKTSSWVTTSGEIRNLGGALFGDCRYDTVFIYHNGVQSYYAARGWRGCLTL